MGVVEYLLPCWDNARPVTEIGYLVHIQPDPGEVVTLSEIVEHSHPVVGCVGMEPIHKHCCPRPDPTLSLLAVRVFDEDIHLVPLGVSNPIPNFNSCIKDRNHVVIL